MVSSGWSSMQFTVQHRCREIVCVFFLFTIERLNFSSMTLHCVRIEWMQWMLWTKGTIHIYMCWLHGMMSPSNVRSNGTFLHSEKKTRRRQQCRWLSMKRLHLSFNWTQIATHTHTNIWGDRRSHPSIIQNINATPNNKPHTICRSNQVHHTYVCLLCLCVCATHSARIMNLNQNFIAVKLWLAYRRVRQDVQLRRTTTTITTTKTL